MTMSPAANTNAHLAPLTISARLSAEIGTALHQEWIQLQPLAESLTVAIGFPGTSVTPVLLDPIGQRATTSELSMDDLMSDPDWIFLPDPQDPESDLPYALLRVGGSVAARKNLLMRFAKAIHNARVDFFLDEIVGNLQIGDSKKRIYAMLGELPGLLGTDHSASVLLPLPQDPDTFVVVAENLYQAPEEEPQEHLVSLLIPCQEGKGGLLEAALRCQRKDPQTPYQIFIPEDDEGTLWTIAAMDHKEGPFRRFRTAARRTTEGMKVLLPLPLLDDRFGFLSLDFRGPVPLSEATTELLKRLSKHLGPALTRSDLFQIHAKRLGLLESLAQSHRATNRDQWLQAISPSLFRSLGATSFAVGLRRDNEISFPAPQGWNEGAPESIPLQTSETLAALSIRLQKPLVLVGGQEQGQEGISWRNAWMVHEATKRIEDARMNPQGSSAYPSEEGWRPLADYYKTTTEESVYVGVAIPIVHNGDLMGVLSMDFDRNASWEAYSGFATEKLYGALANLLASHLALLPTS